MYDYTYFTWQCVFIAMMWLYNCSNELLYNIIYLFISQKSGHVMCPLFLCNKRAALKMNSSVIFYTSSIIGRIIGLRFVLSYIYFATLLFILFFIIDQSIECFERHSSTASAETSLTPSISRSASRT